MLTYLRNNAQSPTDYIIQKFKHYDVILLAEHHGKQENLELFQNIIPSLYAAGVYQVGMEFGASEDQEELDQLVMGPHYDEDIARTLMFRYNVAWPYREYMDVYRVVWEFNQSLPQHSRKFRVLNLSYQYRWLGYSGIKTPKSVGKVFHKGNTEAYRANIISKEIVEQGEKIVVLTGSIHAYTRYKNPVFDYTADDFVRFENCYLGNLLFQRYPGRVFCISCHQSYCSPEDLNTPVSPADGAIEELMAQIGNIPLGFDVVETPMGNLPDHSAYSMGYDHFTLGQLTDGYIFIKPLNELRKCRIDYDFLKHRTLQEVQDNFPDPEWHRVPESLDAYWKLVESLI